MFPTINLKATGINLHRIMDKRGITPKDMKEYLNLGSIQTVYNWCNGLNMPTVDNLYALSELFKIPMDALVCGNRKEIMPMKVKDTVSTKERRLLTYYRMIYELVAA